MARHLSILCVNTIAQVRVHRLRLLRRGRAPRADGPYRLVGKIGLREASDPVHRNDGIELPSDDRFGLLRFTLLQSFPYTQHRSEPG